MADFIRLKKISREASSLVCEFDSSLGVFKRRGFRVDYPAGTLDAAPESVLSIPFAAAVAPIAWAAGADLVLPELDAAFAESLDAVAAHFRKRHSRWPAASRLGARRVRNDAPNAQGFGMLFSGGLDSLSSYLSVRSKKPDLFIIFGADIPYAEKDFIAHCKDRIFEDFSKAEGLRAHYIATDVRTALDYGKLRRYAPSWYPSVQFALLLTALTAPLTYRSIGSLALSSCSHGPGYEASCGGTPEIVRSIRWAGTRVEDSLPELDRRQKAVQYLKKFPELWGYLRVCWIQHGKINCGQCRKCLRTICELLLAGIDPAKANFPIDRETLPALRRRLESRFHIFFRGNEGEFEFWRAIRAAAASGAAPEDLYGSRDFFHWLAGYEKIGQTQPRWKMNFCFAAEKLKDLV